MMKKYLIIFIMIASGVGAADFLDSFGAYRNHVRLSLGLTVTNTSYVSDSTMNQFVRESVVKWMPIIKGVKATFVDTTEYRQDTYTLDTLITGIMSVSWSKNDSVKSLLYAPRSIWYQFEIRDLHGKEGYDARPSYYDYTETELFLFPPPMLPSDTIKITAYKKLKAISSADNLSDIPVAYRVLVSEYTAFLAAKSRTDIFMMNVHQALYNESVQLIMRGIRPQDARSETNAP